MTGQQAGGASGAEAGPAAPAVAWYVGREGQQYGPVGDAEFQDLLKSGQILPTDLVWRDGLAEWVAAATLRAQDAPRAPLPPPAPVVPQQAERPAVTTGAPAASRTPQPTEPSESARPKRQATRKAAVKREGKARRSVGILRGLAWTAIILFFALTLGAAYFVVAGDKTLARMATVLIPSFGERLPVTAPLGGYAASPEATDQAMQRSLLWQVLKKDHADWYAERVQEAASAAQAGKPEGEITTALMQAVVKLRRKYAGDAISAPIVRLKSIASLFVTALGRLKALNVDTCAQFVTAGESAPAVVALLQGPEHSGLIQAELAAIFEGIAEGRRTPRVYPQPRQADYDQLVAALKEKGWQKADFELFADSQRLAQSPSDTVCRLVTDWFEAQLAIKEPDVQLRLIVDSLKPVVAG